MEFYSEPFTLNCRICIKSMWLLFIGYTPNLIHRSIYTYFKIIRKKMSLKIFKQFKFNIKNISRGDL